MNIHTFTHTHTHTHTHTYIGIREHTLAHTHHHPLTTRHNSTHTWRHPTQHDGSTLHIKSIRQCEGIRFVGLWSRPNCPIVPNPAAKAAEYGGKLFASAEELCADGDVDAVLVLTNFETHLKVRRARLGCADFEHSSHALVYIVTRTQAMFFVCVCMGILNTEVSCCVS